MPRSSAEGVRSRSGSGASARPGAASTATLFELIKGMVGHFHAGIRRLRQEEAQRLRLMTTSHLDDGEFARLLVRQDQALIGRCSRDRSRAR
jgi:hypothetical protein